MTILDRENIKRLTAAIKMPSKWHVLIGIMLLTTLAGANASLYFLFKKPTYHSLAVAALSEKTKLITLGTSHVVNGLNPSFITWPNMNLAVPMANYELLEKILQRNLPLAPNTRLLLLEYAYPALSYRPDPSEGYPIEVLRDLNIYEGRGLGFFSRYPLRFLRDLFYPIYMWRLTPRFVSGHEFRPGREVQPGFLAVERQVDPVRAQERATGQINSLVANSKAPALSVNLEA